MPASAAPRSAAASYFALRERLLGPLRTAVLTPAQLDEASRILHGGPAAGLSLYGVPAADMTPRGVRLLGRTAVECVPDASAAAAAEAAAELCPPDKGAVVADLFCGSGNFGLHLGRRLQRPVFASERDPDVYAATYANLRATGDTTVRLHQLDYRDLLARLPSLSVHDLYTVEPPWGHALGPDGLDLTRTAPPVAEIVADISRSRAGRAFFLVLKTNPVLTHGSLARALPAALPLRTLATGPRLPEGAAMLFHFYRAPGGGENG
jgi:hypothetical protein